MTENEVEKSGILKTLGYFFDGFDRRDGELVRKAFHPNAFLYNSAQEAAQGIPIAVFCDEFLPYVKNDPNHQWNKEKCEKEVVMLDITEDAAVCKVEWRYSFLVMTDYYTLVRIEDDWFITNKVWNNKML